MRLSSLCIALALMAGSVPAQKPDSAKVLSAKRTHKYEHWGMVTEPKDKEKSVLTVVQVEDIPPRDFAAQQAKLTCEERDCPLASITSYGRKNKVLTLLVFTTPRDAQKCALSFVGQEPLNFVADAEIRESVSVSEYLK
jgi:hypothetical protein